MYDVVIVGGGPAGSAAAIELATRGVRTALLERDDPPRYKTCGGGIVPRVKRLLPVEIGPVVEAECHDVQLSVLDSEIVVHTSRPEPIISMVMRDEFDHLLNERAAAAGTDLFTSHSVVGITRSNGALTIQTTAGDVSGRFLIAADGALSSVRKVCGWTDAPYLIPALEAEVTVPDRVFDNLRRSARFDLGGVRAGYAWVFPKARHLSVGVLSTLRGSVSLPTILDKYYESLGLTEIISEHRHGFVVPIRPCARPYVRANVFLVGDVAGLADPVTAEGISNAIRSAQIAAGALVSAQLEPTLAAEIYETRLEEEILSELRLARGLGILFYRLPRVRDLALKRCGRRLADALLDVFEDRRTYGSLLKSPRNYLKLVTEIASQGRSRGPTDTATEITGPMVSGGADNIGPKAG